MFALFVQRELNQEYKLNSVHKTLESVYRHKSKKLGERNDSVILKFKNYDQLNEVIHDVEMLNKSVQEDENENARQFNYQKGFFDLMTRYNQ